MCVNRGEKAVMWPRRASVQVCRAGLQPKSDAAKKGSEPIFAATTLSDISDQTAAPWGVGIRQNG